LAVTDRHLGSALEHLRLLAGDLTADRLDDVELLGAFVATRDEGAFALLVRRHGPLVISVCRRVLRNGHDADDAFQATFLLLARKAGSIRKGSSLASWLYGVAYRVALEARAKGNRRRAREKPAMSVLPDIAQAESSPSAAGLAAGGQNLPDEELREVLDDELDRLPQKYRAPVVLCYLQGKTNEEAARILGCPKGTVLSRLSRAREQLRRRLVRRNLALSSGAVTAVLEAQPAPAALPASLVAATARAAVGFASGQAAESAAPQVVFLAERVLRKFWLSRRKTGMAVLMAAIMLGAGAGVLVRQAHVIEPPSAAGVAVGPAHAVADARLPDRLPPHALMRLGRGRPPIRGAEVFAAAFSPNGRTVAVGGLDQIHLWDVARDREAGNWPGHRGAVTALAFSTDGQTLASAGKDLTVRLWNAATGQEIRSWTSPPPAITVLTFSPNEPILVSGSSDGGVQLWDTADGKELATLRGHQGAIRCLAFARDGKLLASGSADKTICVWTVARRKELYTYREHQGSIESVAFSPDGVTLASGGRDQHVHVWDARTGKQLHVLASNWVSALMFAADGKTLLARSSAEVLCWDLPNRQPRRFPAGIAVLTPSDNRDVFSPDGTALAAYDFGPRYNVWDVATGQKRYLDGEHGGAVLALAFSPDGATLASGSDDQTVRLWETATGRQIRVGNGHSRAVTALAFLPGGRLLTSAGDDRCTRQWDVANGREIRTGPLEFLDSRAPLTVSADGKLLAASGAEASAADKRPLAFLGIWDATTGQRLRALPIRAGRPSCFAFSADGTLLAAGTNRTVRIWNRDTGEELPSCQLTGDVTAVTFSADGQYLACACEASVRVWDRKTGLAVCTCLGHTGPVHALAFSPDSKLLASGGADNTVRLWDAASGAATQNYTGHEQAIRTLAFSPDGAKLASGSADTTVLIWDLFSRRTSKP
jgi:RNA polymerase sigma factor (sigma-70 family)